MKLTRRGGGAGPVLSFEPGESELLASVLTGQDVYEAEAADEFDVDDPVMRRLYPDAYPDDAGAEREYRELTESSLRALRAERSAACRADLEAGVPIDLGADEAGTRWIQLLNDLRLTVGMQLGVTEEPPDIDPSDPEAGVWVLYSWLSQVQEAVVLALMEG